MRNEARWVRVWRIRLRRFARRLDDQTPAWLAWLLPLGSSLALHAAILLALGLFFYVNLGTNANNHIQIDTSMFASQLKENVETLGPESDVAGDPFTQEKTDEPLSITTMPDPNSDVHILAEMPEMAKLAADLDLSGNGTGGGGGSVGSGVTAGFTEGALSRVGGSGLGGAP